MSLFAATQALQKANLGDIVVFADQVKVTVRAVICLPYVCKDFSHLLLLGDLDIMLAVPRSNQAVLIFHPHEKLSMNTLHLDSKGATAFWAPHLPAEPGAMGELEWSSFTDGAGRLVLKTQRGNEILTWTVSNWIAQESLELVAMAAPLGQSATLPRRAVHVLPPFA